MQFGREGTPCRVLVVCGLLVGLCAAISDAHAQGGDLVIDGSGSMGPTSMTMGGIHHFDSVRIINGGELEVETYDGNDKVNTGNLVLVADSIVVDEDSRVDARGAGYQTPRCADGRGPEPANAGQGGCAVRDSGGGGAHFGGGGRGTKDCFIVGDESSCQFPDEFSEDCGNSLNSSGDSCTDTSDCRNYDALPTVAGQPYYHSIWEPEFGASGGDKGCRDGDGFGSQPAVGGAGGGRVVLAGITDAQTGTVQVDGTISAAGKRGCGTGNDSGGGGAGGSVLVIGDQVTVGGSAQMTAAGGLGGDTFAAASDQPDSEDCPDGAQTGGTCDDCGGGGGGGIVTILSRATSDIDPAADFDVSGAEGGTCPICKGEAGGGAGELQLDGAYVGEQCDGYDNDFDGSIDEGFGQVQCGLGNCARDIEACSMGAPVTCSPMVDPNDDSCTSDVNQARPRVSVVLDTSASMLLDLEGYPTFGDGSTEHPGLDTDGDGEADDSRLFLAKDALARVISAYPEIDFALARYHQDQAVDRSCQTAKWFECQGLAASYDEPGNNTGPDICEVQIGPDSSDSVEVKQNPEGDQCINYAGSCGPPRRGADILSGFGSATRDLVRWLDGEQTDFRNDVTPGDVCGHSSGGDCELRATGPTPLAGSLKSIEDYVVPIRATDPATGCRGYSVILVTDGAESCGGNPVQVARRLHDEVGIEVFVVGVSVLSSEEDSLDAIAMAGSGGERSAVFVRDPANLVPALTDIVAGSIRFEKCNGVDDDCDGAIDEEFPSLGDDCDNGEVGVCRGTGTMQCASDGTSTECVIDDPGASAGDEQCNDRDDDCDRAVDEGLSCTGSCTPSGPEECNGMDDDCDGLVDETDPNEGMECGQTEGVCEPGEMRCVAGELQCVGGTQPQDETCNGLDDDCDGMIDEQAPCPGERMCIEGACRRPCDPTVEFPCPVGFECLQRPPMSGNSYCVPTACGECSSSERCVDGECIDPCEGVECEPNERCVGGSCRSCHFYGCDDREVCFADRCQADPCAEVQCGDDEMCVDGSCEPACDDRACPAGQSCSTEGRCQPDPCAELQCDEGSYCAEGECIADPCADMTCVAGDVCVSSSGCIDDPCPVVECPAGRRCRVAKDGTAQCVYRTAPPSATLDAGANYTLAAGGGGGACTVANPAAARAELLWVCVAALFLLGRSFRRRGR